MDEVCHDTSNCIVTGAKVGRWERRRGRVGALGAGHWTRRRWARRRTNAGALRHGHLGLRHGRGPGHDTAGWGPRHRARGGHDIARERDTCARRLSCGCAHGALGQFLT